MIRLFDVLFILFKGNDGSAAALVSIFYVKTPLAEVAALERAADHRPVVAVDAGLSVGQVVLAQAGVGVGAGGVFQRVDQREVEGLEPFYGHVDVNGVASFVDVAFGFGEAEASGGVHPAVYEAAKGVQPVGGGGGHQGRVYGGVFGTCQAGEKREQE